MIKKIKKYFSLQRKIQLEIIETLITICLYLNYDSHFSRYPRSECFAGHFKSLKSLSDELREREQE